MVNKNTKKILEGLRNDNENFTRRMRAEEHGDKNVVLEKEGVEGGRGEWKMKGEGDGGRFTCGNMIIFFIAFLSASAVDVSSPSHFYRVGRP